jgi:hypothetical protein
MSTLIFILKTKKKQKIGENGDSGVCMLKIHASVLKFKIIVLSLKIPL